MKRALLAAALMIFPAVAFGQSSELEVPQVPRVSLIPTIYEMELLRERRGYRAWVEVLPDVPRYRVPLGGDPERELAWSSSPFGSSIPAIVLFRW